ncbi:MAG: YggT family protein [Acidimicrobiales bacterium]
MGAVEDVVRLVVTVFLICLFVRVLLSYFPISPGTVMYSFQRGVGSVTEPVLAPVRRFLPPVNFGGATQIDLSPIVLFVLCFIILAII